MTGAQASPLATVAYAAENRSIKVNFFQTKRLFRAIALIATETD